VQRGLILDRTRQGCDRRFAVPAVDGDGKIVEPGRPTGIQTPLYFDQVERRLVELWESRGCLQGVPFVGCFRGRKKQLPGIVCQATGSIVITRRVVLQVVFSMGGLIDHSQFPGAFHCFRTAGHGQLFENVGDVLFGSVEGNEQLLGNLGVGITSQ
jgi:hypothetical protein